MKRGSHFLMICSLPLPTSPPWNVSNWASKIMPAFLFQLFGIPSACWHGKGPGQFHCGFAASWGKLAACSYPELWKDGSRRVLYSHRINEAALLLWYPCNGRWAFPHLRKSRGGEERAFPLIFTSGWLLGIGSLEHRRNKKQTQTRKPKNGPRGCLFTLR